MSDSDVIRLTPDLSASEIWLAARSPGDRKRLGQWATPWWLCEAVATRACRGLPDAPVVVDPACGDGRWLLAVARERPRARLVGLDVDPLAIAAARATLAAAGVAATLHVADALADGAPFPDADLVVGNPPWVRVQNVPTDVRRDLWARYVTATDKADLYACFVERALDRARRVAFVLPAPWLGLASFAASRARVLAAGADGVFRVAGRVFHGATVDAVVLFVDPADRREAGDVTPRGLVADRRLGVGAEAWSTDGPLPELPGRPLAASATLHMGVVCGDYDRYVHTGHRGPDDRPTCRGRDVRRWHIADRGELLRWLPDDMLARKPYVAPKHAGLFDVPCKIVIAGTSGTEIRAAIDEQRRFPLDSCYVAHARPGVDPWGLLGLLLSRRVGDWYAARHRAARVKAVELARIPLPSGDWRPIADAARAGDDAAVDAAVDAAYAGTAL